MQKPELLESFSDLQVLSRHFKRLAGVTQLNFVPGFPKHLTALVERWEQSPPFSGRLPKADDDILLRWSEYEASGSEERFAKSELVRLCQHPVSATDPRFHDYFVQVDFTPTTYAILGLVYCYHAQWRSIEPDRRKTIENRLQTYLLGYSGCARAVLKWKENLDQIVGPHAPETLGKLLAMDQAPPSEFALRNTLQINTEFWSEVIEQAATYLANNLNTVPLVHVKFFTRYLLDSEQIRPEHRIACFGEAILSSRCMSDEVVRTHIVQYGLQTSEFGDPRVSSITWRRMQGAATERFISWLSREDIKLFFDLVMQRDSDRHGRKRYWLKMADQIKRSRVLLSHSDHDRLLPKLNTQKDHIPSFGKLTGYLKPSAFILDFGNVVVVEFSEVGAIYVYPRSVARDIFGDLYKPRWNPSELRHKDLVDAKIAKKIPHVPGWKDDMNNELQKYGLTPPG